MCDFSGMLWVEKASLDSSSAMGLKKASTPFQQWECLLKMSGALYADQSSQTPEEATQGWRLPPLNGGQAPTEEHSEEQQHQQQKKEKTNSATRLRVS